MDCIYIVILVIWSYIDKQRGGGSMVGGINNIGIGYNNLGTVGQVKDIDENSVEAKALKRTGAIECSTCKSRKYQDGSDEMVSFKVPGHISPEQSASKVMAHENEHVANAFGKAAKMDGEVVRATVSLQTAICPECGCSYVSGGLTSTSIKYNEDNPYDRNKKSAQEEALKGQNIDYVA